MNFGMFADFIKFEVLNEMRKVALAIILFITIITANAQVKNGVHKKLADFYISERWEDCSFKSERMSYQAKYEKDPEVFLYMAASYNKIFLMCLEDSLLLYKYPEYLNSYSYALKYSVMAKKKDKRTKIFFPDNDFMLEEIAISGFHYINNYVRVKKNYVKANSFIRKIMKTYTDDNIYFLHGVLSAMTTDSVTSMAIINEVFTRMDSVEDRIFANTDFMMIEAFDYYVHYLLEQERPLIDSAQKVITKGLQYFPDNENILYLKYLADNPELDIEPPENKLMTAALKRVAVFIPNNNDEIEIEEDDYDE
ncbi:MAG: hypothetical protein LBQ22_11990 [Bacteroidales bacterium]|jgi:hypothetical protein|nr:hypothetical protein [Bacteroidales bacterium]